MPERFEIYIVYKRRYINTLPFLFFTYLLTYLFTGHQADETSRTRATIAAESLRPRSWFLLFID